MEKNDERLIQSLLDKDAELKRFYDEHVDLERQITLFQQKAYLTPEEEFRLNLMGYGAGLVTALIYYAGTELLCYRTPAKFLTGTIVVAENGGPPTSGQILGRTLCRFIPFEAFSFLGTPSVGWHDTIPKTRVVDAR